MHALAQHPRGLRPQNLCVPLPAAGEEMEVSSDSADTSIADPEHETVLGSGQPSPSPSRNSAMMDDDAGVVAGMALLPTSTHALNKLACSDCTTAVVG